ncbi:unnamed protein product [Lepeophtheirus salmonis]|uniref:(salmon louse) hypothetical protein n=1 Tax=Lepeophtheirus salmonis TaxID=72036 RepID=A0A7R8CSW8_LEPSM|nr:unnamed protein product [Lepeophtheirus salmonis]CAF2921027.1 unnamed protein product [Lepeophtheirus salmonis]
MFGKYTGSKDYDREYTLQFDRSRLDLKEMIKAARGKAGGPSSEFGLGGDIVLSLTSSLKFTYGRVFADNYFRSKKRKGLPEFIQDKELGKTTGSMDAYVNVNAGVGMLKWFDNRATHIISSMNACHDTVMVNCRKKGNSKKLQIP